MRATRGLGSNLAKMNFGFRVVPGRLDQQIHGVFKAFAVQVTVGVHPSSFLSSIVGDLSRSKEFLKRRGIFPAKTKR